MPLTQVEMQKEGEIIDPRTPSEIRRTTVTSLLAQGLDIKVLMGGGDHGAKLLKDAYDQARTSPPLHWPFPHITAYRLAYILMRDARSRKELNLGECPAGC
jgi:hypothetical protein